MIAGPRARRSCFWGQRAAARSRAATSAMRSPRLPLRLPPPLPGAAPPASSRDRPRRWCGTGPRSAASLSNRPADGRSRPWPTLYLPLGRQPEMHPQRQVDEHDLARAGQARGQRTPIARARRSPIATGDQRIISRDFTVGTPNFRFLEIGTSATPANVAHLQHPAAERARHRRRSISSAWVARSAAASSCATAGSRSRTASSRNASQRVTTIRQATAATPPAGRSMPPPVPLRSAIRRSSSTTPMAAMPPPRASWAGSGEGGAIKASGLTSFVVRGQHLRQQLRHRRRRRQHGGSRARRRPLFDQRDRLRRRVELLRQRGCRRCSLQRRQRAGHGRSRCAQRRLAHHDRCRPGPERRQRRGQCHRAGRLCEWRRAACFGQHPDL